MENWNWTLSGTETMWNTHAWNQFSPTCRANKGKDRCGLHASLSYCQARVPNLSWPSPNEATSPPTNNFASCFTLKTWPVSVLLSIILSVLYFWKMKLKSYTATASHGTYNLARNIYIYNDYWELKPSLWLDVIDPWSSWIMDAHYFAFQLKYEVSI